MNRRPQLELLAPGASPVEAAAVVAALERFMRDTAPRRPAAAPAPDPWRQAALVEGVGRGAAEPGAWGQPSAWGWEAEPPTASV